MRFTVAALLSILAVQQAAACDTCDNWNGAPGLPSCPNACNQCNQDQHGGFNFGTCNPGQTSLGGLNFGAGCGIGSLANLLKRDFAPRGLGSKRWDQGAEEKCLQGPISHSTGPSLECDKDTQPFSINQLHVSCTHDTPVQFTYHYPSGQTCQHTAQLTAGAPNVVQNSQCGGASKVSCALPPSQPAIPGCSLGIHNITFECNNNCGGQSPPAPPPVVSQPVIPPVPPPSSAPVAPPAPPPSSAPVVPPVPPPSSAPAPPPVANSSVPAPPPSSAPPAPPPSSAPAPPPSSAPAPPPIANSSVPAPPPSSAPPAPPPSSAPAPPPSSAPPAPPPSSAPAPPPSSAPAPPPSSAPESITSPNSPQQHTSPPVSSAPASSAPASSVPASSAPVSSAPESMTSPNSPITPTVGSSSPVANTSVPVVTSYSQVLTTQVVYTTVNNCSKTIVHTKGGHTSYEVIPTISVVRITETKTICTLCEHKPSTAVVVPPVITTSIAISGTTKQVVLTSSAVPAVSSPVEAPSSPNSPQQHSSAPASAPASSAPAESVPSSPQQPSSAPAGSAPASSAPASSAPVASSPSSPIQPSQAPPKPAPAPPILPSCLQTWLKLTQCKDNSDSDCFCKDSAFTTNVQQCISSWAGHKDEECQALSYLAGICAPHVPQNPGIIANVPKTITLVPTPPVATSPNSPIQASQAPGSSAPAAPPVVGTTAPPAAPPAGQPPASPPPVSVTAAPPPPAPPVGTPVPHTVITISTTITTPCAGALNGAAYQITDGQIQAPASTAMASGCPTVINTQVTVPKVAFSTASPGKVGLVAGTPPTTPAQATNVNSPVQQPGASSPPYPTNGAAAPAPPVGTAPVGTAPASTPAPSTTVTPFKGAASSVSANSMLTIAMAALGLFVLA